MAFPTTGVLDNFTGTDGTALPTYSANWGGSFFGDTNLQILTNTANCPSASCGNYWQATQFGPDSEAYGTIALTTPDDGFRLFVRCGGTSLNTALNAYQVRVGNVNQTTLQISRTDAGTTTVLGANIAITALGVGDMLGISVVGNTITAYINYASGGGWASVGSRTDSTYSAAGYIALEEWHTTANYGLDNFGGGTVVAIPLLNIDPIMQSAVYRM
ncbi:MAG: hypothetical protein HXX08_11360 [Chloroflexi bacterium]|uniref:Uncharacterized protein n=1 Tax=Candidatus Chlorohelix allophototropha TaxID=3003348 RepID=A0A8T7LZK4_9CHLR|nr:hypothetical protein [Chloroflexota bacterium]WJW65835.1 hypothetical protein OZ401_001614 [Chloroflexota bacterium L227-S17]